MKMLDQESITLEDVGFQDDDAILAEIRSRDGTWPEEISSLCGDKRIESDRHPLVAGVTGKVSTLLLCFQVEIGKNKKNIVLVGRPILALFEYYFWPLNKLITLKKIKK